MVIKFGKGMQRSCTESEVNITTGSSSDQKKQGAENQGEIDRLCDISNGAF